MPLKLDGTYGVSGVVGTASSAAVYGADVDSGIVFSGNQTLINSDGSTIATVGASGINVTGIVTATSSVRIGTGASISSPTTNILALGTNNVERIRVGAAGSIGIGTDNPTKLIDMSGVHSGINTTGRFVMSPHAAGWDTGVTSGNIHHHYIDNFRIYSGQIGSGTERFKVDSSGRVTKPYQPVSCVYGNAGGSVNTGSESTWVIVKFANSTVNRGSAYSSSTGLYTCPVAGVYFVSAFFLTRANAAHNITIYKNGAGIGPTGRDITPSGEQNTGVMAYVDCAANDTLAIYFSNGSGGDFYVDYNYALFSLFG